MKTGLSSVNIASCRLYTMSCENIKTIVDQGPNSVPYARNELC